MKFILLIFLCLHKSITKYFKNKKVDKYEKISNHQQKVNFDNIF